MMIFAVDFDGTLVLGDSYPNPYNGTPNWPLVEKVKAIKEHGHEIVLWTCRCNNHLDTAVNFCTEVLGLQFTRINASSPEKIAKYENSDPRKIGADYYIDDKCLSPHEFLSLEV